jgi:hypothetical protein
MNAWQWLENHPTITLTVRRSENFNSIQAKIGEKKIFFNINPLVEGKDDKKERNPYWAATVSHELELHLLPYVRVTMYQEQHNEDNTQETENGEFDNAQAIRASAVLDGILSENLITELAADVTNKETKGFGGNHSDLSLWTSHLRDVMAMAKNMDKKPGARLVSHAIEKMLLSMLITGEVKNVIVRSGGEYKAFVEAVKTISEFEGAMKKSKKAFLENIGKIINRATLYSMAMEILPALAEKVEGGIDETLLIQAIRAEKDEENRIAYYLRNMKSSSSSKSMDEGSAFEEEKDKS